MNPWYEQLIPHLEKMNALNAALTLFSWDNETLAPSAAIENTSKIIGILSMEAYHATIDDEVKQLLTKLSEEKEFESLSLKERTTVKKLKKSLDEMEKIPPEEYQAYSELTARAGSVWATAKQKNDFASFAPVLKEILTYRKKFAGYIKKPEMTLYDCMLDSFECGMTSAELDVFFDKIRTTVVPLLKRVVTVNDTIDKAYNSRIYPDADQRKIARMLAGHIGFDFSKGVIADSEHPFTTSLHNHDVRITNHIYEDTLESAIFSVIHEGGHALYEMGVDDDLSFTPAAEISMSMHESQSRFYENCLARDEAFWIPLWNTMKETYPQQLKDVSLHQFTLGINKAVPGPIRTESDELTYPLHIMIRYEIEKLLTEDRISVDDLPKIWNEKYEEYLGITPANDTVGVLQDVHWSGGMFGYFPSYAIGNAIAAQILSALSKEMDVQACLASGDLSPIHDYLREHVHKYAGTKSMNEILVEISGEPLNVDYYIQYLTEKYTRLYLQ